MKTLLALALLGAGYLIGSVERPSHAQLYGYDSAGNSYSFHPSPIPGGPTYYYGSDGTSGMYAPTAPSYVPDLGAHRNPC